MSIFRSLLPCFGSRNQEASASSSPSSHRRQSSVSGSDAPHVVRSPSAATPPVSPMPPRSGTPGAPTGGGSTTGITRYNPSQETLQEGQTPSSNRDLSNLTTAQLETDLTTAQLETDIEANNLMINVMKALAKANNQTVPEAIAEAFVDNPHAHAQVVLQLGRGGAAARELEARRSGEPQSPPRDPE